jgi:mRNA interferase RelE/StbE
MTYSVLVRCVAVKELIKLPDDVYGHVRDSIYELARDPRPLGCVKLSGRHGWRIRTGDYRVIYDIDEELGNVVISYVGHRKDIYR